MAFCTAQPDMAAATAATIIILIFSSCLLIARRAKGSTFRPNFTGSSVAFVAFEECVTLLVELILLFRLVEVRLALHVQRPRRGQDDHDHACGAQRCR